MSNLNYKELTSQISVWLQNVSDGQAQSISEELVGKAMNIVIYLHSKNEDEVFLQLCALNLLNAAIKTETYKDHLSYDLIKSNAAKLVTVIDNLKKDNISYYYNKEEYCLYFGLSGIVFSFHHVPLTSEILKASFANPITWPGIRLQKIAHSLLNYAISLLEDDTDLKAIIEKETPEINKNNVENDVQPLLSYENKDKSISKKDVTSPNEKSNESIIIPNEVRENVAKQILSIIREYCIPDPEGWFDLVKIAPKLKANGVDYSLYGFQKLALFLEAIFGDSMQRRNVGNTMVYLKFPLDCSNIPITISNIPNDVGMNQNTRGFLSGVKIGDDVEISTFGILKSGKISLLNEQFVQLELKDNKSIRIRLEAISSIESKFSSNSITNTDLSFSSAILKEILIAEDLYSSSTIDTNATITMVESRRIWLTTDDKNTGTCYKGSIIGYNKEKLVKGQRVFAFPLKKEIANCVIMEMTYYELFEIFEYLVSTLNKAYAHKRTQILRLLAYIKKKISHTESLKKVSELRRQMKKNMPHSASSNDDSLDEEISDDDKTEKELPHEILNENESLGDAIDTKISINKDNPTESLSQQISQEVLKPESVSTSIQGPKIIGKIDLAEIGKPKKKKEGEENDVVTTNSNDSISIDSTVDLLPSMGKIKKMWATYGYIKPYNQEKDLYFYTSELVSYAGIIESPSVGDEVVYSLGQNNQGPIALCIHKQCTKDIVEDLVEKFRYDTKTCSRLKKHIENFDNLNSNSSDNTDGLSYYLEKIGVNPRTSFSLNDVEKSFAEKLSSNEYAIAIELLIDEVVKKDPSKCYNLFLRSSSYAKSHKMYDVSRHLIEKALEVFKGESGKVRYFKGLYKSVESLTNRIEINEKTLANSLEISGHVFPFMPVYVRDFILSYKDFNGITPDKDTIRTGLYKEEYIEELKESIKQNNADDLLYLTLMKLQLAFHPTEYNPKDDIAKFLVNRAKNILATGDESRYSDVRYLFRLAYKIKSIEKGFDNTVGLYLMTLGDYAASEIEMFMNKGDRSDYKFEDLLKNALSNKVDNSIELTLLAESNPDIKNRIIREYDKIGKNADSFDDYPVIIKEIKNRFTQYSSNPAINFMSLISYLQTTAILLDNEVNVVKNDSVKVVSYVTDFNTGQKYNVIRDAFNNITQKIDAIIPNLIDHPTEIGYETILPALRLLKKNVRDKFEELEQRADPTIEVDILESVELEDSKSVELKIAIRNSGDSARSVHINSLNVYGEDLAEDNNINIDVTLPAGEEKLTNVLLPLRDNAAEGKIAEVEFEIKYDDIYIATEQRIPTSSNICKTINFEIKPFVEIENKFRQCSGGEELGAGDDMFFGRNKLISDIQEVILKGTKNQIAIYGQKRSGKSSLLNQIKGKLESDESHSVICGKFSLSGLPANELNPVRWILESIVLSLLQGIRKCGIKKLESVLASLSIDMDKIAKDKIYDSIISKFFSEESDAFKSLGSFIGHINTMDEFQNSHFVIFIDEFTYLYQLIKKDKTVNEDFMRRWIALIEMPGINLQAIVAAQDTLPHFMNESYASNCFNKFSKEPLSYLTKEEALQLIKDPIKDVMFHNHSDELIYGYTSGSAFFTQIFCTKLVDYLNSEKSNVVGKEEVEMVAERLCTGTHRLEKSTFECLTKEADGSDYNEADNIRVLKAIAEHTRAGGYVNMEDLHVDFAPEKLKSILGNLDDRRVISRKDKGYSINVKLFVKWILNN